MAADEEKTIILRVFSYEPGTKTCKQKRTLEFPKSKKPSETKLEAIRSILVQNKVLGSLDARSPFCNTVGAEMSDQMLFSLYLGQLDEEDQQDTENGDGKEKETEEASDEASTTASGANKESDLIQKTLKVYYKKKKVQTKTDDATQEFLKKQLDLKLRENPELKHLRAELLKSAFQADKWQASAAAKLSVAADMTERDWSVLVRTNCLLSGQRLTIEEKTVKVKNKDGKEEEKRVKNHFVERTPFNAFKIKKRLFDSYEIAAPAANVAPGKGASTNDELGDLPAHIPRFRVDDVSYMTVIETQNSLESSMAKSSFSETSIEASAGGGLWGVSAAAKGGFSLREGLKDVTANAEEHKRIHVVYNFPRVTVFLDADSLELTEEVKMDIKNVETKDDVIAFGEKYGHIFSRRVKVGGRLMSTHQIDSTMKGEQEERENSLKIAAAASFSGPSVSGSVEGSHESGGRSGSDTKKQDFASNMSWEATGGSTTLCNDPPQWCGTVGNFRNWRIVEQGDIIPLTTLISTFQGFEGTEAQFRKAAGIAEDGVAVGQQVRTRIQLINTVTKKPLVALPSPNRLKSALEKISAANGGLSPSVGTAKEEILRQVSAGCITYDSDQEKHSNWIMERWVEKDQSAKHPYGAKTFIFNEEMPEESKFLCLTDSILDTDGSGFLYPGPSSKKAWFTLQTPPGKAPKAGPLETKDIVELRVRDSGDSADLGILMNSEYHGSSTEIKKLIKEVPAFAPRNILGRDPGTHIDRSLDAKPGRFLQFEIVVKKWF